jgi:uncharacterized radical SAM superfamily protein
MHQQFRHVDAVRRLYRLDHQMLLVRHQHLVCDKENLNLVHQLLVILDENQLLVNLLLVELVVDVQQNRDALNLDVVLTLVDVRLDEVDVVQVDVALHLHRIQKDYFQHVVDVALLKELKESMELKELMQQAPLELLE